MRSTAIDRRRFLLGGALASLFAASARAADARFVAACAAETGGYELRAFDAAGRMAWALPLPARGHGTAQAGARLAAFARRPGSWTLLVAAASGVQAARIAAPDGFAFNGHGAFGPDGRTLAATATGEEDESGWLLVFDGAAGWRLAAAWPTRGRDPHEVLRLGDVFVVANGGLPEGRPTRDLSDIDTSLAWLDARDGALLRLQSPPSELRRVSLRHMAAAKGRVFVAGQDQGPVGDGPPLLAVSDGRRLEYLQTPPLGGYCGSIAAAGDALCLTSPRAGRAVLLDVSDAAVRREFDMADVCGAAAAPGGGFLLTSGRGALRLTRADAPVGTPGLRWDNHAAILTAPV